MSEVLSRVETIMAFGSPHNPVENESRNAARKSSFAEVWVDPGGTAPAIPCAVVDISSKGAKLGELADARALPERFVLRCGDVEHAARIVWRRRTQVGVVFVNPDQ